MLHLDFKLNVFSLCSGCMETSVYLTLPESKYFFRFSDVHEFKKPNDVRGLSLMNAAARSVMEAYPDVVLAFGESDEYR